MTTLEEFTRIVHGAWPLETAEPWDAPGLTVGVSGWPIRRVLIAVDAVADTVAEAIEGEYDLLLTHHPLLLRGVTSVSADRAKGALVTQLIQRQCALLSAHTNADIVTSGATQVLANLLGLTDVSAIIPSGIAPAGTGVLSASPLGLGRVGVLPEPQTLGALARRLSELLPATAGGVRGSGDWDQPVRRVALCSGAGDSLLDTDAVRSADLYITSDLRHHTALESREESRHSGGPALLDISHWASEWLWCAAAAAELAALAPNVQFDISELRTDPWDFTVLPAERTS